MIPLALLFGFNILMSGGNILGIHASFARKLDLPGAWIVPWLPVIATVVYALAVFGLHHVKKRPIRWFGFILATFVGHWIALYPLEFFQNETVAIRLPARLNKESVAKFDAAFPVKHAYIPSSRSDVVMRVRREDYSEAMAQFAKDLVQHQGSEYP